MLPPAPLAYLFSQVAQTQAKVIPQRGDSNIFGRQQPLVDNFFKDFFKAGGSLSNVANYIPGASSVARFHDVILGGLSSGPRFWIANAMTIPHAVTVTPGSLLNQAPSTLLVVDHTK